MNVALTNDEFKTITKITSRPQIVIYIALLDRANRDTNWDWHVNVGYIDFLLKETPFSKGTITESLQHLAWDGHIEKTGDPMIPFPDCPILITSRKQQ